MSDVCVDHLNNIVQYLSECVKEVKLNELKSQVDSAVMECAETAGGNVTGSKGRVRVVQFLRQGRRMMGGVKRLMGMMARKEKPSPCDHM